MTLVLYDTKNQKYNGTNVCRGLTWKLLLRGKCVFMQIAIHDNCSHF